MDFTNEGLCDAVGVLKAEPQGGTLDASLAALREEGLVEHDGTYRNGRPVYVVTRKGEAALKALDSGFRRPEAGRLVERHSLILRPLPECLVKATPADTGPLGELPPGTDVGLPESEAVGARSSCRSSVVAMSPGASRRLLF